MALYKTMKEAAQAWVDQFSVVPSAVLDKLMRLDCEEVREITPPTANDRVCITYGDYSGQEGMIVGREQADNDLEDEESQEPVYIINLDDGREVRETADNLEVQHDSTLPMWNDMWTFGSDLDNDWLEEHGGLQLMADCGFRIYEQQDYRFVFGIDGAGYSFLEHHFIPLYKARGLEWHDSEEVAA